jgi:hypothetical protein
MAKFEPLYVRFWKHVDKTSECWMWTGTHTTDGYGLVRVQSPKRTNLVAHRVAWELTYGPIPASRHVLHRCDNPPCVRPDHLFLGDNAANVADRVSKGRSRGARGERNHKAKLTIEQVREIRVAYIPAPIGHPRKGDPPRSISILAERYGVTRSTIYHIVRGWNWTE